eukprot:TRINITY_DN48479_c0_g1_i1.p1 TRINITY_DN48479_c0_g1~~TRINITY_DN48479_c0_g1_i1.p1  ORF type:complete len:541 (-),score=78.08 TRINITY_DN48479_c0_g1_i1:180-1802(-)
MTRPSMPTRVGLGSGSLRGRGARASRRGGGRAIDGPAGRARGGLGGSREGARNRSSLHSRGHGGDSVAPRGLAARLPAWCEVTVAHCIAGAARSFVLEEVYGSILSNLVVPAAPVECQHLFYVLELDSRHDSPKGGTYSYSEEDLWAGPWRALPPAGYVLNPGIPPLREDLSFKDARCFFGCVPSFEKARVCEELMSERERGPGGTSYSWVITSRPDVRWLPDGGFGRLAALSNALHVPWDGADLAHALPRRHFGPLVLKILSRCIIGGSAETAHCGKGPPGCNCWVLARADALRLKVKYEPLRFSILRLKGAQCGGWDTCDPEKGVKAFSWGDAMTWNLKLRGSLQRSKDLAFVLGNMPVRRTSPSREHVPLSGCLTRVDTALCFKRHAGVINFGVFVEPQLPGFSGELVLGVGLYRTNDFRRLRGNSSGLHLVRHIGVFQLPRDEAIHKSVEFFDYWGQPLLAPGGSCLGWTVCGSSSWIEPVSFDEPDGPQELGVGSAHATLAYASLEVPKKNFGSFGPFHEIPRVVPSVYLNYTVA